MLSFLTDEHISHIIAEQVRLKRPDIRIESILRWRDGNLRNTDDALILTAAYEESLALVTYDQKTIPPLLVELGMSGGHHAGVIFVDRHTIASDNIGGLVQALIALYDWEATLDWTDRIVFLSPSSR